MSTPHLTCPCKLAFTIPEFCAAVKVSRGTFYALDAEGRAPSTFNAGRRRLISVDAARAWVAERERESAGGPGELVVVQL